jgi:hypothetical protein
MRAKEVAPNIYHVHFGSQRALTSTFLRFQEHYESPKFRGKVFSREEFKAWYTVNSPKGKKTGKFTYYTDWTGFNIPSRVLKPFYAGKFDPLSKQEQAFLKLFKAKSGKFYIIGTFGKQEALDHEIAHGLFSTNSKYRAEVRTVLRKLKTPQRKKIEQLLNHLGYHKASFEDEVHAYILEDLDWMEKKRKMQVKSLRPLQTQLKGIYKKYARGAKAVPISPKARGLPY